MWYLVAFFLGIASTIGVIFAPELLFWIMYGGRGGGDGTGFGEDDE